MEADFTRPLAVDIPIVPVPMTGVHVTHDILIAAPAEIVWGVTADVSAWPIWSPTITSVENRGGGPLTDGMIFGLKQPLQPLRSWIVLHCEAPHALILGTAEGDMVARHQIAKTSRGTLNTLTLDYAGPFPKLLRPALRMALRMENFVLKKRCEALSQGARKTTVLPICDEPPPSRSLGSRNEPAGMKSSNFGYTAMTSRTLQFCLSAIFLLLGAWCLLFPGMVVRIAFRPELATVTEQARFLMGCFGAQAVLCGTILATARFTPMTFLVFGLVGSVPFFVFNVWFWLIEPVLNSWMLLDLAGNVGILVTGIWGWRLALRERLSPELTK